MVRCPNGRSLQQSHLQKLEGQKQEHRHAGVPSPHHDTGQLPRPYWFILVRLECPRTHALDLAQSRRLSLLNGRYHLFSGHPNLSCGCLHDVRSFSDRSSRLFAKRTGICVSPIRTVSLRTAQNRLGDEFVGFRRSRSRYPGPVPPFETRAAVEKEQHLCSWWWLRMSDWIAFAKAL